MEAQSNPYRGPVPLTLDQHLALRSIRGNFFINVIYDLPQAICSDFLQAALEQVVTAHDALRARFQCTDGAWTQEINAECRQPMAFVEHLSCTWNDSELSTQLRDVADRANGRLSLSNGPLLCAVAIHDSEDTQKLLVCVSHLVADGRSLTVIVEDLFRAYANLRSGNKVPLSDPPPIDTWSRLYREWVNSDAFCEQLSVWEALPWNSCPAMPLDFPENTLPELNVVGSSQMAIEQLDVQASRAIQTAVPRRLRMSTTDFLTIALAQTLMRWSGGDAIALQVIDAGRSLLQEALGLKLAQTVAALAIRRCVFLQKTGAADDLAELSEMHRQLEALPYKGAGYLMLKYVCDRPEVVARAHTLPVPEVWLSYLGVTDASLGRTEAESADAPKPSTVRDCIDLTSNSPGSLRNRTLGVVGQVRAGTLHIGIEYSTKLHAEDTARRLAADYKQHILRLLDHLPPRST